MSHVEGWGVTRHFPQHLSIDGALLGWGPALRVVCRQRALQLESYKVFVDAGWFLDIAPYASRKDGFTFQKTARALAGPLNASFDR